MAVAALASSSGVAVSSTTKGLSLMFTLLCLVRLSSALIDKDQLEQLRETYWETRQQIEILKVEQKEEVVSIKELMKDYMHFMDTIIRQVKNIMQSSGDDDFPPLDKFMDSIKNYVKKTKAYIDMTQEEFGGKIEEGEKKLEKTKKLIEFLEEQGADL